MKVMRRAFLVWATVPYLTMVLLGVVAWAKEGGAGLGVLLSWEAQRSAMWWCLPVAAVGTVALWRMSLREHTRGVVMGSAIGVGLLLTQALVSRILVSGYESASVAYGTLLMLVPSCLLGAYAGHLRVRDLLVKEEN